MLDQSLGPHAKPPQHLRAIYKLYQKAAVKTINQDGSIFDASQGHMAGFQPSSTARQTLELPDEIQQVISKFLRDETPQTEQAENEEDPSLVVYEHPSVPGLYIFPSLLSSRTQLHLLTQLFHRDLSNPAHQTNLHMHYNIPYPPSSSEQPKSFFSPEAQSLVFEPKDPTVHKPLSTTQVLNKKLRWMTLGGQYDWTQKVYPSTQPPPFPADVAQLIEGLFPAMKAQAAIFNLYSPGDTLSLHRDVSEECNRPLVSISLGCEGIFVVGLDGDCNAKTDGGGGQGTTAVTIRLRSGDAVVMSGVARTAWHSIPQVIAGTCPTWMEDWPCTLSAVHGGDEYENEYEHWKGWMKGKRINLNVRQMWDS